ncbi:MAG TPA: MFS transporter, partial [Parvularculaceae bacterium]|nr:MFS transporter [Parvularculaceae bacterium]
LLAVIQTLHALTFATSYVGSLEFIDRAAPKGLTTTAMTLNSTLGVGAVTGLAIVASGYLYQWGGACAGYSLMAVMGVCGLGAALLLRRRWDGGALFAAGAHSEKREPVSGEMRDKTKTRSSPD